MKKDDNLSVVLKNISKRYIIHHEKPTLIEKMVRHKEETFYALKKINLTIYKGEKVGIIGLNGSGKTTLLKIISGITVPTEGLVSTSGRIVSLIDLEAGFHPDLAGYQNIILNAMLIGMSKKEVENKLRSIIKFADIKQFIDTPLFTYSEGMKLRLGFSIAVNANPEILIMDENFIVADREFRKKSFDKIRNLLDGTKTIIISSHYLEILKHNCQRVIWLNKGKIVKDGPVNKVLNEYSKCFKGLAY